jgi:hypothetical protein
MGVGYINSAKALKSMVPSFSFLILNGFGFSGRKWQYVDRRIHVTIA